MRFFALTCLCTPGEPALALLEDEDVEIIAIFRTRTAAEVEASMFQGKNHEHAPTVMEFECKAI